MDTKVCAMCGEEKELDLFTINRNIKSGRGCRCKECDTKKNREEYLKEIEERGGLNRVNQKPNQYDCEVQKEMTFQFLYSIGWHFNEEKGIWWKEGIKTEEGKFLNIKKYKRKIVRKTLLKSKIELYNNYQLIYKGNWTKGSDIIPKWAQMFEQGFSYKDISKKEELSEYIIRKYISLYYETH